MELRSRKTGRETSREERPSGSVSPATSVVRTVQKNRTHPTIHSLMSLECHIDHHGVFYNAFLYCPASGMDTDTPFCQPQAIQHGEPWVQLKPCRVPRATTTGVSPTRLPTPPGTLQPHPRGHALELPHSAWPAGITLDTSLMVTTKLSPSLPLLLTGP